MTVQSSRPDRARSHPGTSPIRDIRSDWRRWSVVERVGAVTIGAAWFAALSLLLVVTAG
jgi:hypothetical protein